jgi:aryl-alcohol dehydrogenase-like predicted oxidoreductase
LPWYPLGVGNLASAGGKLAEIARRHHATPSQVALAWLLRRSPAMLPIPGMSSIAHFEESLAATRVDLTDGEVTILTNLNSHDQRPCRPRSGKGGVPC